MSSDNQQGHEKVLPVEPRTRIERLEHLLVGRPHVGNRNAALLIEELRLEAGLHWRSPPTIDLLRRGANMLEALANK